MEPVTQQTRMLPVLLSAEEFDAKAAELASVTNQIEQILADKKASMADFKGKLDAHAREQKRLAGIVEKRSELREVDCEERVNPDKKIVELVRVDTGEVVDTRTLTPFDIQRSLGFLDTEING